MHWHNALTNPMTLGLLLGLFILGPPIGWALGIFNPAGYFGIPPWRVPPCTCGRHHHCGPDCPRGQHTPR